MKLLFMITALHYSGAPKMLTTVANWFAESGEDVTVCTYFKADANQMLHENVKFECLNIQRSGNKIKRILTQYLGIKDSIYKYVVSQKPDVFITFGDIFSTMALKKIRKAGICTVVSERADPSGDDLISKYRRHAFKNASGYVFQTEGAKKCFDEDIQSRGYVIPNPVNVSDVECLPYEERKKKIVSVGRFEFKQKRQDVLIKAFAKVYEKHPDYELYLYGDGEDMETANVLAQETDAKAAIFFPGAVRPAEKYIKDASILVLSSDYEGIPNAVIEAMNMKIPVISTDCSPGGARLLLGEDEFGYIVPKGDDIAMAEKINYVIEHPDEAREKSDKAKDSLSRFESSKIAKLWITAIDEIVNK